MLIFALFSLCVSGALGLYNLPPTNWDEAWTRDCPPGFYMRRLHSYHHNGKEDRRWTFGCEISPVPIDYARATYTRDYVNALDGIVFFQCPGGRVLTGVTSYHHNGAEDRRFKFQCAPFKNSAPLRNCAWTGYINSWDKPMNYMAAHKYAIKGLYSHHDNGKEDRIWKLEVCQF